MDLEAFVDAAPPAAPPTGFIFHMSRCGSTLAARMLATRPGDVVVSEAPPLDDIVQLAAPSEAERARRLIAMVAGLGRSRAPDGRFMVKLDSWHTLALPLFRRAFPATPWVFLYREPARVVASHMREPGMHTVHGMMPAGLFACETSPPAPREDYVAQVLAEVCSAVLDHLPLGGGRLVNYDALPDAVWTEILPHFGEAACAGDLEAMRRAAEVDAKATHQGFQPQPMGGVTDALRGATKRYLTEVYEALEGARRAQ
jgi:hypothetical protein